MVMYQLNKSGQVLQIDNVVGTYVWREVCIIAFDEDEIHFRKLKNQLNADTSVSYPKPCYIPQPELIGATVVNDHRFKSFRGATAIQLFKAAIQLFKEVMSVVEDDRFQGMNSSIVRDKSPAVGGKGCCTVRVMRYDENARALHGICLSSI